MKAWRFYGFNDMRLDEVPAPACLPGHVLAEILCVQPSVTEAQLAFGIPTLAYERIKRRLESEAPVQLFGHEFCARIVETGAGVSRFRPGDRVAARAKLPCGDCPLCRSERGHLCRRGPIIGFQLPGCFAEYAVLPEIALTHVDDCISDSEAACLQSLSDSVAAVETAGSSIVPHLANYGALSEEKADFLYNLAKSYLGIAGDPVRGKDLARELQSLGQTVKSRWVMGESLLQQSDIDGALGEWRGVLELDPGNLDALFSLGTYYMDSHDYWKADPYLEKANRQYGDASVVRYNYGRNLYYLGRHPQAIDQLKEARRIAREKEKGDDYPLVDYLIGVSSHKIKKDKEAAESLETYLKWAYTQPLTRLEVDAHIKLAEAYDNLGKRFQAHKERQKGEDLLRRLQGQAYAAAPPPAGAPAEAPSKPDPGAAGAPAVRPGPEAGPPGAPGAQQPR